MELANASNAPETSRPLLGLMIGVPLSLCIWAVLAGIAVIAVS